MLIAVVAAMSAGAAAGARSAKAADKPTYTGCVESVNHGAAFLLTNVDTGMAPMGGDMKMKDHDDMAMQGEPARTMPHEEKEMPMADEKMDAMPSKSFALAGSTSLSRHVGQRVSVTGPLSDGAMGMSRQDVSTITVKTLRVVAKSCS